MSKVLQAIDEANTFYSATYDPKTELYTTHSSHGSYEECPSDSQWIINTGLGKKEFVTAIDPRWPNLSWYIPSNRVMFSESDKYSYGRIRISPRQIEVYNND